jgi:hypothetical protein
MNALQFCIGIRFFTGKKKCDYQQPRQYISQRVCAGVWGARFVSDSYTIDKRIALYKPALGVRIFKKNMCNSHQVACCRRESPQPRVAHTLGQAPVAVAAAAAASTAAAGGGAAE